LILFWLRLIVTCIIPIAVAMTVPLRALRGELGAQDVLIFVGIGIVSFWVATRVWKAGVKMRHLQAGFTANNTPGFSSHSIHISLDKLLIERKILPFWKYPETEEKLCLQPRKPPTNS
jgi:hypothetical protein